MNHLVFSVFRGARHGGMMGPAGYQAPAGFGGNPPAPPAGVIQLITLLSTTNANQSNP